ncbi:MAG: hypothetical protein ACOX8S_01750 [Christensenellales bacterium]
MNKKQWLNRVRDLDSEIKALIDAMERAYSDATRITGRGYSVAAAKSAGRKRDYTDALARVYEYEDIIEGKIIRLYEIKHEVQEEIDRIDDPRYRTLMIHRYINLWCWEKIALKMNYSYDYVKKELHSAAMEAFMSAGEICQGNPLLCSKCKRYGAAGEV